MESRGNVQAPDVVNVTCNFLIAIDRMRRVEGRLLALLVVVVMVVVMGGEEQMEGGGTEEVEERSLEVDSEIEGMCDSERPSHRSRRFITYTGIGIGALALLVFAFFVKYILYFTIRKYHEGDARMFKDDLHFLTSLITHLEESY
ncbi:hypothetical protein O3P69_011059 [Scylla paramamosain]|uniref:Uncharacterized protein n=1 Tax=Scylla paramamosain TaxID=85552 RepID=A0AAW0SU99_SCYPA